MLENNEFRCPQCLKVTETDPPSQEYTDDVGLYCEHCEFEWDEEDVAHKDFWYEQSDNQFAREYLKLRGYKGEPQSWYAVWTYLVHFIEQDTERVLQWKDEQWEDAYNICCEYYGKPILPISKEIKKDV